MDPDSINQRLSQISTKWTMLHGAHGTNPADAQELRKQLLHRYGSAVHRYLLGALRDAEAADDLFQEFSLRFLRGKMGGATQERGRFREFVKATLYHMVADHYRARKKLPSQLPEEFPESGTEDALRQEFDQRFVSDWREELLQQSWKDLERFEKECGGVYYTVLRLRSMNPNWSSEQMAIKLEEKHDRRMSSSALRQTLHRAREKYSSFLLNHVVDTLSNPTADELQRELIELDLFEYCRPALAVWSNKSS